MTTPQSPASGSTPERTAVIVLIEQLQASCSWKAKGQRPAYFCAILYGFAAALQGFQFFILYCGILTVICMLQTFNDRRTHKQMGLLVQLVKELEKKKHDDMA